jgi:predicted nuclease of restriction endonuclease-like (RecB) superfamily
MKKQARSVAAENAQAITANLGPLIEQVRALVQSARRTAAASVNALQVRTNFEIGRRIVEHEQAGESRAAYGAQLLKALAERLTGEFGRGFSRSNLEYMRKFFLLWQDRAGPISQKPSGKLPPAVISKTASAELAPISETPSRKSALPFTLSWSHYVVLLSIKDPGERSFYEIEAANSGWSVPELKRQLATSLYERLALSRDKQRVRQLAEEGHTVSQPADLLKEPYVLEFLGLEERPGYSETDLETALIDRLQHFLLELGKGFLFEARQKRFTFDEDHFFVDLVFYNRLLRCYVLIDLKLDKLTHQDLGQMQMYVNYFDRHVRTPEENPTLGILLCKRKKDAIIELTLPKEANVFASQYELYLPSKDDLRQRLMQWTAEEEGRP